MTDLIDSRAIRRTDCYAQRFMQPGRYSYAILPAHCHAASIERPFRITVTDGEKGAEMAQHNVIIRSRGGRFIPDSPEITIAAGDLVLWNCIDSSAPPYAVIGDDELFGSHRLTNECGYSHAFGLPGEYRWTDAYGSGVGGVITVADPGCTDEAAVKRWHESIGRGTVVVIADGKAEPAKVEIQSGQTIFFAVVKGPGISITDERLIGEARYDCAAAA